MCGRTAESFDVDKEGIKVETSIVSLQIVPSM